MMEDNVGDNNYCGSCMILLQITVIKIDYLHVTQHSPEFG